MVERAAVDSVIESKLHPPPVRAEWIARPRLVAALERSMSLPVVLLAAPAGFGKSTLVTQWHESVAAAGPAAWLCLDPGDNDPVRLWLHLATALQRVGCAFDVGMAEIIATSGTTMLTRVVPGIIEALERIDRPVTVVLDDCHVIRSVACREQLDYLLDHLPEAVHVALIARSDPALRLGRLRVEGRLSEIRTKDLSFTADETRAVLQVEGVQLTASAVDELASRTEGWPAAVYLAALSLGGRDDPEEFVHELSGNNRFIADYLTEEVLNRQDAELRDFILDMSVFDRFNVSLGNHVTQTQAASRLLRVLERTNLFLIPMDAAGNWFRFHHLFGTFARSALEAANPDRAELLHFRGAEWFAAHDHIEEAIQHHLAGGSAQDAAVLVQSNWVRYLDAGRIATVLGWLRGLHDSPADKCAETTVTAAWIAALTGRQAEMSHRLVMLESMAHDGPLPDGAKSVESARLLIRAMFGYDGPDQMLADSRRVVELETDETSTWYAAALVTLGHASYVTGDLQQARDRLSQAAAARVAPATIQVLALAALSLCEAELGATHTAARLAAMAMRVVEENAMQPMPQASFAFTATAAALAASGDLEAAWSVLESGLQPRRLVRGLSPWPLIHHLVVMATVAAQSGRHAVASELILELEELTPWTDATMATTRTRIAAVRRMLGRPMPPAPPDLGDPLTPREVEVLRRLQSSQSLREIANDLYVSHNTIKTFTVSLYRKLGVHSRSEAIAIARSITLL
jgi:LuxR family transcriptional regulator, maltose regulon positive regulatory protein